MRSTYSQYAFLENELSSSICTSQSMGCPPDHGAMESFATLLLPILVLLNFPWLPFAEHLTHLPSNSLIRGRSLSGSQTIVSRGGRFELGFFTPGTSRNYYIGIWYKAISERTVIWVANREAPLARPESSELKISDDGNLVLLNGYGAPVWSSNITARKSNFSTVAVLQDDGDLVLKERADSVGIIWQSFDQPTDTWVPGAFVGVNKVTGEYQVITSWKNSQDPAPGMFSHRLSPTWTGDYLTMWNGSVVYDHTGDWKGNSFLYAPVSRPSLYFGYRFIDTGDRKYVTCDRCNSSVLVRLVMDVSGQLKIWTWLYNAQKWVLFWTRPEDQCAVYSACGAFGVCKSQYFPPCDCLPGFEPKFSAGREVGSNEYWSDGCVRKSPLVCTSNSSRVGDDADVFIPIHGVKFPPSSYSSDLEPGAERCKLACSENCSCSAYAYQQEANCLIWTGQIHNLQQLSDDTANKGGTVYLRLASSEQAPIGKSSGKRRTIMASVITACLAGWFLIILSLVSIRMIIRRRHGVEPAEEHVVCFNYSDLTKITKKFSVMLGKGGFGTVFSGELPADSTRVAVKKLQGLMQGEKQFRAEVRILATVQHSNLVRLRGFCAEGADKRLLVYDFMPNGSLDSHLFRTGPPYLDWLTRYNIATGTARGLAYLHEECRERIIHCDIKPENILLDESRQPKVADFGLAKLLSRDFSRAKTTLRGTIGYLAPEWISGEAITPQADVYSFGMMLFELVSGRRNVNMLVGGKPADYFPLLAAYTVNSGGDVFQLLDDRLGGNAKAEELERACTVACWCIQDGASCRPTMGQVVRVLEGSLGVGVPPIPRTLLNFLEAEE